MSRRLQGLWSGGATRCQCGHNVAAAAFGSDKNAAPDIYLISSRRCCLSFSHFAVAVGQIRSPTVGDGLPVLQGTPFSLLCAVHPLRSWSHHGAVWKKMFKKKKLFSDSTKE